MAPARRRPCRGTSNLGRMHRKCNGVPQNHAEPTRWCRLATGQGDANAQSNLGLMCANGTGVPHDHIEAAQWCRPRCRLAAGQGDANAQYRTTTVYNLGVMYKHGTGLPQDYAESEAVWLLTLARDQGFLPA